MSGHVDINWTPNQGISMIDANVAMQKRNVPRKRWVLVFFFFRHPLQWDFLGRVGHGTLKSAGQIDVEEGSVHALDQSDLAAGTIGLAIGQVALELVFTDHSAVLGRRVDSVGLELGSLFIGLDTSLQILVLCPFVGHHLSMGGSGRATLDLSDAENRLPAVEAFVRGGSRVSEAGSGECTLGPAVVEVGEVPLHGAR